MALNPAALQSLSLALPLVGAALLVPGEAEACSPDPCIFAEVVDAIEPVNSTIPIDGVLLLQAAYSGEAPVEDWIARIDLTVTRDGQPIAGALEPTVVPDLLLWRPAEPLEPGATFHASASVDNPELDDYYEHCSVGLLVVDWDFDSDLEAMAPLVAPVQDTQESVLVVEEPALDNVVCCDDAMPYLSYDTCSDPSEGPTWIDGWCFARRGSGYLVVQASPEHELPPATAALVRQELLVDGELGAHDDLGSLLFHKQPSQFCTAIRLRNLATGETVMSEETCHGATVVLELGAQDIDPSAELAASCAGPAYVCEVGENGAWDPERCAAWPDGGTTGDPTGGPTSGGPTSGGPTGGDTDSDTGGQDGLVDHGCACDSAGDGPPVALGLLALGLLRRRRRR